VTIGSRLSSRAAVSNFVHCPASPNYSFKPNPLRGIACVPALRLHAFAATAPVGLTQVLDRIHKIMAISVHFIERMGHVRCLDKAEQLYESGWWAMSEQSAQELVGGRLYLHKAQDKPSFFGGSIQSYRLETEGEWPGRVLFSFIADQPGKGFRTSKDGWRMERKIDRSAG
jgi:hypothetical protein